MYGGTKIVLCGKNCLHRRNHNYKRKNKFSLSGTNFKLKEHKFTHGTKENFRRIICWDKME
jgi:hypothetical protein